MNDPVQQDRVAASPRVVLVAWLVLVIVALPLALGGLGASGLWDPWEPKYAQTAREMAARGDWVVPYYREEPRLVKPPLTYWLIGAAHAVGGVDERTARLPSALLALVAAGVLGGALAARGYRLAGPLAAGALLTAPQWLLLGRFATPDVPFAAMTTLVLGLALVRPTAPARWIPLVDVGLVAGVAASTLAEWPRGLLLPCWVLLAWGVLGGDRRAAVLSAIVAATYVAGQYLHVAPLILASFALAAAGALDLLRRGPGLSWRRLALGTFLVLLLTAPWFVAVLVREPAETLERLFGYKHGLNLGETFGRHRESPFYVLRTVAVGSLPWFAAAASGLWLGLRRREPTVRVLAAAFLGGLLFFSLSEARMGHFYAVLQPPVAGLAALGAVAVARRERPAILLALLALAPLVALTALKPSLVLETATVFRALDGPVDPVPWILAGSAGWLIVTGLAAWRRNPAWLVLVLLPALALPLYMTRRVVPDLEPTKSFRPMWLRYRELSGPGDPLVAYGFTRESIFYYSNNRAVRIKDPRELHRFLQGDGDVDRWIIAPRDATDQLRRLGGPGGRWRIVDRRHASHVLLRHSR